MKANLILTIPIRGEDRKIIEHKALKLANSLVTARNWDEGQVTYHVKEIAE